MQRKPRIAYLLKTYPKLSETFILNEILGLEKLGVEIEIFSLRRPTGEPVHPSVAEVRAPVTYIPAAVIERRSPPPEACQVLLAHITLIVSHLFRYIRTALSFHAQYREKKWKKIFSQAVFLAAALQRGRFHHLHAHFANLPASIAERVYSLCGISYSFTAHAKDIYLTERSELKNKIAAATCVLTCTAYNQRYLSELSPGLTPIHLAYHGVDVGRFDSAPSPRLENTVPLILSVGRFCEKKGFPYLIQACRILKDRGYRFQCRIVGFGELEPALKALIAELDVADCVAISGKMPQNEVIAVYRQASVFVLPCLVTDDGDRDGIPNVLMEAMVSRIPVVSTRVSGITELVDHMVDGILVAERDAAGIAGAMETLLRQPLLRQRLGESGRAKVLDRFALEASARRVRDILLHAAGVAQPEAAGGSRPVPAGYPGGAKREVHG